MGKSKNFIDCFVSFLLSRFVLFLHFIWRKCHNLFSVFGLKFWIHSPGGARLVAYLPNKHEAQSSNSSTTHTHTHTHTDFWIFHLLCDLGLNLP
jgi:hypothetical protein